MAGFFAFVTHGLLLEKHLRNLQFFNFWHIEDNVLHVSGGMPIKEPAFLISLSIVFRISTA